MAFCRDLPSHKKRSRSRGCLQNVRDPGPGDFQEMSWNPGTLINFFFKFDLFLFCFFTSKIETPNFSGISFTFKNSEIIFSSESILMIVLDIRVKSSGFLESGEK